MPGGGQGVAEVRFSNAAETDLADIDEFSATHFGEDTGEAYMRGFDEAFARLADFPSVGPSWPEPRSALRCLVHRSHRIFYRLTGEGVFILRVLHHAQDARRHLDA